MPAAVFHPKFLHKFPESMQETLYASMLDVFLRQRVDVLQSRFTEEVVGNGNGEMAIGLPILT